MTFANNIKIYIQQNSKKNLQKLDKCNNLYPIIDDLKQVLPELDKG